MATFTVKQDHKGKTVVYADGCYDLMHYGHANSLRQAKSLGDYLIVGVHSDEEIMKHKGPPVMKSAERYAAVRACKWVDEVYEGAPYIVTVEILEQVGADFCIHGEDVSLTEDGSDVYQLVKDAGKMRTIKRTEGVSTTDIVGRMLLMTTEHLNKGRKRADSTASSAIDDVDTTEMKPMSSGAEKESPYTSVYHFLPTTRRIVQFSEGKFPNDGDKIVFMDGGFDLFNPGHAEALRQAKALGDFLVVGVHDDEVVHRHKGLNYPIMTLHERVLSVLACRSVDEVVIGAPFHVTSDMVKQMKIDIVVHGDDPVETDEDRDPYEVPKKLGIYKEIKFTQGLRTTDIVRRIIENKLRFESRNKSKSAREVKWVEEEVSSPNKKQKK